MLLFVFFKFSNLSVCCMNLNFALTSVFCTVSKTKHEETWPVEPSSKVREILVWSMFVFSIAGTAQVMEGGQVEYKPLSGIRFMWWYHLIGLVWTSEFILACQRMTTAGAVTACYFNRWVQPWPQGCACVSGLSTHLGRYLGVFTQLLERE